MLLYLVLFLFNSIFSLLKKFKLNAASLASFNVWFLSNASSFLEKTQSFIVFYINFIDTLSSKKIKFYKNINSYFILFAPLVKIIIIFIIF